MGLVAESSLFSSSDFKAGDLYSKINLNLALFLAHSYIPVIIMLHYSNNLGSTSVRCCTYTNSVCVLSLCLGWVPGYYIMQFFGLVVKVKVMLPNIIMYSQQLSLMIFNAGEKNSYDQCNDQKRPSNRSSHN